MGCGASHPPGVEPISSKDDGTWAQKPPGQAKKVELNFSETIGSTEILAPSLAMNHTLVIANPDEEMQRNSMASIGTEKSGEVHPFSIPFGDEHPSPSLRPELLSLLGSSTVPNSPPAVPQPQALQSTSLDTSPVATAVGASDASEDHLAIVGSHLPVHIRINPTNTEPLASPKLLLDDEPAVDPADLEEVIVEDHSDPNELSEQDPTKWLDDEFEADLGADEPGEPDEPDIEFNAVTDPTDVDDEKRVRGLPLASIAPLSKEPSKKSLSQPATDYVPVIATNDGPSALPEKGGVDVDDASSFDSRNKRNEASDDDFDLEDIFDDNYRKLQGNRRQNPSAVVAAADDRDNRVENSEHSADPNTPQASQIGGPASTTLDARVPKVEMSAENGGNAAEATATGTNTVPDPPPSLPGPILSVRDQDMTVSSELHLPSTAVSVQASLETIVLEEIAVRPSFKSKAKTIEEEED
ncbi:uncharacterized protein BJ171DRAFT_626909 [Polychytrium aggregatum]|uniref:uncharacterized protein n=1 Tax=Polychytrium aggregatum TaxID=110093 RepID=UPI0022FE244F|nr:uncharacterized protein BJ171DRAFT_626909 [Polychytrium aggregatum]KAI9208908.1 hypothetical protein BJ171DRAFT_626909 [Polychytrium aggregatum]